MSLQALSRRRSATGPGRQDQAAAPPHLWQNLSSENASTDRPDNGGAGTRTSVDSACGHVPRVTRRVPHYTSRL
jgi:hypothetical protein